MKKMRCMLIIAVPIIIVLAEGLSWGDSLDSGLVAYYPFNGNANDESGQGNHGTMHGGAWTSDRFGNMNQAVMLDGIDDYIEAASSDSLNIQDSITIAVWFKTDNPDVTEDGEPATLVAKHYTQWTRSYALWFWNESFAPHRAGMFEFRLHQPDNGDTSVFVPYVSWFDNRWHMVAATYDYAEGTALVYLDGLLQKEQVVGQFLQMTTTIPLTLGCYVGFSSVNGRRGFYRGCLDDVRLYNRALSASEIAQLYWGEGPSVAAGDNLIIDTADQSDTVLQGTATDPDNDPLQYRWLEESQVLLDWTDVGANGETPLALGSLTLFSIGEHTLTLQVTDAISIASDDMVLTIQDTTAPSLSPIPSVTMLWPPNHKLQPVAIQANVSDNSGGAIHLTVQVISSEPPDAMGDGQTVPDYYIDSVNDQTGLIELRLRSESSGKGSGRTYTVVITATDESGNQSIASVEIKAPHDKGSKK